MRLPIDPERDDGNQSVHSTANGTNHNVPDEQTFDVQLPTIDSVETVDSLDVDDQQDIDYLSLATGHVAATNSETDATDRLLSMSLIDRVLASPEQTYEQLLASFTYLSAVDVLQMCDTQSISTAVSQSSTSDQPQHLSSLSRMLTSSSACDEQKTSKDLTLQNTNEEDAVEELVLKEIYQSEPCPFGLGRQLQVDNFLLTDDDSRSDDEVDCDHIGTLPKYNVLEASFITKDKRHADVFNAHTCCRPLHQSAVQTEITSDVVEPFCLDPDFDYDNVELSAKFTQQDLSS